MNPSSRPDPVLPALPFPEADQSLDCNNGLIGGLARPHWDICPNCSSELVRRRAMRVCPRCVYYLSGSDPD